MDEPKNDLQLDIPRAWLKRRDELAQLLRDCQHDGRVLENDRGDTFCERCGARLTG